MRRLAALLLGLAAAACAAPSAGEPGVRWIDNERGRDGNDGATKATAWRHLPGDAEADGRAAAYRPTPGDRFVLVAGSRYRGAVVAAYRGTAAAPIVIEGEAGPTPAIVEGADPVASVALCRSADACGGAPNWQRLARITFRAPIEGQAFLFTGAEPLNETQAPAPADPFYGDEVAGFLSAPGAEVARGSVRVPAAIAAAVGAGGGARILVWSRSNRLVERPVLGVAGATVRFDPAGLDLYPDRPTRIAFRGGAGFVDRPGDVAWLPGREAAVAMLPPDARELVVATGRTAFDVSNSANLTIRNLTFARFADDGRSVRSGSAIAAHRGPVAGLTIANNVFRDFVNPRGQGPIILYHADGVVIRDNRIEGVRFGSAIRLADSRRIRVTGNEIARIGRTGVMLMNTEDALVARNRIHDLRGLHGNGLSAYLGNRDTRFVANSVWDAKQPATYHGSAPGKPPAADLLFARNLLVATDDAVGALSAWGGRVANVVIRNNVILGGAKVALKLPSDDLGLVVADNLIAGIAMPSAGPRASWRFSGNATTRAGVGPQPRGLGSARTTAMRAGGEPVSRAVCAVVGRATASDPPDMMRAVGAEGVCPPAS